MKQITKNIFIGNSSDARNVRLLHENKITSILNCAFDLDLKLPIEDDTILRYKVGLIDGPGNDFDQFKAAVIVLGTLIQYDGRVFVHCHEGRSRSVSVVAAMLGIGTKETVTEVIEYIRNKGIDVNIKDALMEFLERHKNIKGYKYKNWQENDKTEA